MEVSLCPQICSDPVGLINKDDYLVYPGAHWCITKEDNEYQLP